MLVTFWYNCEYSWLEDSFICAGSSCGVDDIGDLDSLGWIDETGYIDLLHWVEEAGSKELSFGVDGSGCLDSSGWVNETRELDLSCNLFLEKKSVWKEIKEKLTNADWKKITL